MQSPLLSAPPAQSTSPTRREDPRRDDTQKTEAPQFADRLREREKPEAKANADTERLAAEPAVVATPVPAPAPVAASNAALVIPSNVLLNENSAELNSLQLEDADVDPLLAALAALLGLDEQVPEPTPIPVPQGDSKIITLVPSLDSLAQDMSLVNAAQTMSEGESHANAGLLLQSTDQQADLGSSEAGDIISAAPIIPGSHLAQSKALNKDASHLSEKDAANLLGMNPLETLDSTYSPQNQTDTNDTPGQAAQVPAEPTNRRSDAAAATTGTTDIDALTPVKPTGTPSPQPEQTSVERVRRPESAPSNPMEKAVTQQVTRALMREGPEGQRTLSLRLTPPELGTVRIEIIERGGVLQAHLHAEDEAVRHAIERQLSTMRQDLRANDAPVRDVQLGDAWSSDLTRRERDGAQNNGQRSPNRSATTAKITPLSETSSQIGNIVADERVDARA
jgi:flagellar hook-length control protein FliK